MKKTLISRIIILILFSWCCFFPFTRDMPSSGGVPGLSGLEAVIFVIPYFIFLFLNLLNITIIFFKKRGFPIFMIILSVLFIIVFYYLSTDWNYNITEALNIYLWGPIALLILNILVFILRNQQQKLIQNK